MSWREIVHLPAEFVTVIHIVDPVTHFAHTYSLANITAIAHLYQIVIERVAEHIDLSLSEFALISILLQLSIFIYSIDVFLLCDGFILSARSEKSLFLSVIFISFHFVRRPSLLLGH